MLNADRLNNGSIKSAVQSAYAAIDAIQMQPAHIQCQAAAILFREVCRVHKIDGQQVMQVVANMAAKAEADDTVQEFRALQLYANNELRNA